MEVVNEPSDTVEPSVEPGLPTEPTAAEPAVDQAEVVAPAVAPVMPATEPEGPAPEPTAAEPVATAPETAATPEGEETPAPAPEAAAPEPEAVTADAAPVVEVPGDAVAVTPPPKPEIRLVPGRVLSVGPDVLELQLLDGQTAVVERRDASGPSFPLPAVGDEVDGAVLSRTAPDGRMLLSLVWAAKHRAWERVAALAEAGETFDVTVRSASDNGVVVDAGVRGFVPSSHLEIEPVADLAPYVGRTITVKVLDLDVDRERLVLTRRSLLLREQRKRRHRALADLKVGDRRTGRVTKIVDYGAFVDVGDASGLVHVSEMSWNRVRRPADLVSIGDEVEVEVLDVKVKKRRLSLSMRRVNADPLAALQPGGVAEGTVSRLADFGAFVDLGGIDGLVHRTELAEYRINAVSDVVVPGDHVRVVVLSVDRKRRRVELSMRQAATAIDVSA